MVVELSEYFVRYRSVVYDLGRGDRLREPSLTSKKRSMWDGCFTPPWSEQGTATMTGRSMSLGMFCFTPHWSEQGTATKGQD
jgi:hypothetical protein